MASDEIQVYSEGESNEELQNKIEKFNTYWESNREKIFSLVKSMDAEAFDAYISTKPKSFNQYWEQMKKEKVRVKELEDLAQVVGAFDPATQVVVTKEQLDITKQLQSLTSMAKQIEGLHSAQSETDIKIEIKQAFTEAINPPKKAKKLTPAEQFEHDVKGRSQSRILQAVKKAAKK